MVDPSVLVYPRFDPDVNFKNDVPVAAMENSKPVAACHFFDPFGVPLPRVALVWPTAGERIPVNLNASFRPGLGNDKVFDFRCLIACGFDHFPFPFRDDSGRPVWFAPFFISILRNVTGHLQEGKGKWAVN